MSDKQIFLATTALESFWEKTAKRGLFLGEWCKLYDRKEEYKKLNFKTLDYIWKDEKEIDNGIKYCESIYQSVLKKLIYILNNYNHIDKDFKYWDMLLKPWLLVYIQIIYDKYKHLELANSKFNNLYTYTLNEEQYQYINIPNTFLNSIVNNDEYNLQIYSQIIKFLQIENFDIEYNTELLTTKINLSSTKKEIVFRYFSKRLNKLFCKKNILIVAPYFKNNILIKIVKLSLKSNFLFSFDNFKYDIFVDNKVDFEKRKQIFNVKVKDKFESLIYKTFIHNFPLIYLEFYEQFDKQVRNLQIPVPNAIYSVNALHGNEIFKFYVAKNYNNMKVLYGQHGGNIGVDKINIPENIEKNFSDIYYTFGWIEKDTIVLPLLKDERKEYKNKKAINFIMTVQPRYFYRFVYQEESSKMIDYIENSKIFLSNLKNINNLVIRMYPQDNKWNIEKRLLQINKNLKFNNKINYYKQIRNAKLNVFDHMHTGYLETLSMNIPTIIIIPKNIYCFRDSAKPYIEKLKDVKILFENPIEASNFVDKVYDNIDSWWLSEDVQKIREEFCYNYARTSEDWVNEWVKEFNEI